MQLVLVKALKSFQRSFNHNPWQLPCILGRSSSPWFSSEAGRDSNMLHIRLPNSPRAPLATSALQWLPFSMKIHPSWSLLHEFQKKPPISYTSQCLIPDRSSILVLWADQTSQVWFIMVNWSPVRQHLTLVLHAQLPPEPNALLPWHGCSVHNWVDPLYWASNLRCRNNFGRLDCSPKVAASPRCFIHSIIPVCTSAAAHFFQSRSDLCLPHINLMPLRSCVTVPPWAATFDLQAKLILPGSSLPCGSAAMFKPSTCVSPKPLPEFAIIFI